MPKFLLVMKLPRAAWRRGEAVYYTARVVRRGPEALTLYFQLQMAVTKCLQVRF